MIATDLHVDCGGGVVTSALLLEPAKPLCLYLLAHGAGAGMRHPHLERLAERFAEHDIATLRYQFPYREAGRARPDPPPVAHQTVRSAAALAQRQRPDLPLVAGGRSYGGRMTSQVQATEPMPSVRGLVFLAFPLHPPKRPGIARAQQLARVRVPMLFLTGTRDDLADLELLRGVAAPLPNARLHVVEGADHSFSVLKRSGRTATEVATELATTLASWVRSEVIGTPGPPALSL